MANFIFEVERTYTWNVEVDADTREQAKEKLLTETVFNEDDAQQSYLEIADIKLGGQINEM